jgi:hypothetical protein
MIVGTSVDWHRERRALIDMVTHYLTAGPAGSRVEDVDGPIQPAALPMADAGSADVTVQPMIQWCSGP